MLSQREIDKTGEDREKQSILVENYLQRNNPYFISRKVLAEKIISDHFSILKEFEKKELLDDMLYTFLAFGFQPDEYFFYHFAEKTTAERKNYVSDFDRNIYFARMNDICEGETFLKKNKTYKVYKQYYKRDVIAINRGCTYWDFESFIKKFPVFVQKKIDLSKGDSVELVDINNINMSPLQYFHRLKSEKSFQLEEKIKQSEAMRLLNESSVNTIRCNAFVTKHGVEIPFTFIKVGRAGSFVDNGGKGGILVGIDRTTGVLDTDGRDEFGNLYSTHPENKIKFKGYQLPDWSDVIALCKEITPMVKGISAIGWDLAHTNEGWVIVEGNLYSQFVGPQIVYERGIKKELIQVMNDMNLIV